MHHTAFRAYQAQQCVNSVKGGPSLRFAMGKNLFSCRYPTKGARNNFSTPTKKVMFFLGFVY